MTLSFRHDMDPLFTIAVDERGRHYRILLASGTTKARFYLSPWAPNNARVEHRGRYVDADSPLFPAVDAAEKARPRPEYKPSRNFEAEFA